MDYDNPDAYVPVANFEDSPNYKELMTGELFMDWQERYLLVESFFQQSNDLLACPLFGDKPFGMEN